MLPFFLICWTSGDLPYPANTLQCMFRCNFDFDDFEFGLKTLHMFTNYVFQMLYKRRICEQDVAALAHINDQPFWKLDPRTARAAAVCTWQTIAEPRNFVDCFHAWHRSEAVTEKNRPVWPVADLLLFDLSTSPNFSWLDSLYLTIRCFPSAFNHNGQRFNIIWYYVAA